LNLGQPMSRRQLSRHSVRQSDNKDLYFGYLDCFFIRCIGGATLSEGVAAAAGGEEDTNMWDALATSGEEGTDRAALGAESEEGEGALVAEGTNQDGASSSSSSSSRGAGPKEANWLLWDCSLSWRETSEGCCGLEVRGRGTCGGCGLELTGRGACSG
jgi:hypothetical protein